MKTYAIFLLHIQSIVNGYVVPLKEEHRQFLIKTLVPLHKSQILNLYHRHLVYCVLKLLDTDFTMTEQVNNN